MSDKLWQIIIMLLMEKKYTESLIVWKQVICSISHNQYCIRAMHHEIQLYFFEDIDSTDL